jgi:hypothetical protein
VEIHNRVAWDAQQADRFGLWDQRRRQAHRNPSVGERASSWRESQMTIDEVKRLYASEWSRRALGARRASWAGTEA